MLESKLGPLATLQIERVKVKDSMYAQAILARIGRDNTAHLKSIVRAANDDRFSTGEAAGDKIN